MAPALTRRQFLASAAALAAAPLARLARAGEPGRPPYSGPNVLLVRFGGGARRRETIDPGRTFSPYLCRVLAPRGTLFRDMRIAPLEGLETSHGQGTLNLLTGIFDRYKDVGGAPLGDRFEAKVPTLFEYLRRAHDVADHEALIVNGEDRTQEEFYAFSNHPEYGEPYRAGVLSLYRFKTYLLRRQLADWTGAPGEREERAKQLAKLEDLDYRVRGGKGQSPAVEEFWGRWRAYWGDSGLVHPRGDRLLTELALWALRELKPRFMAVHYQDCDYVHWGNPSHYTRGISVMDEGLRQLVAAVDADPGYRGRTVVCVAPDCGRDDNRLQAVPFQHHFNSRSAREVFALLVGPGVPQGRVVDRPVSQADVAPTLGRLMGVATPHASGRALPEARL